MVNSGGENGSGGRLGKKKKRGNQLQKGGGEKRIKGRGVVTTEGVHAGE